MPRIKTTLNNRWLVAGLCLLALVLAARAALSSDRSASPDLAPGALALAPTAGVPSPAGSPAMDLRRDLLVAAPGRDPFAARPPVSLAPPVIDTVQLSALWTENGETLALVNGRILRSGDTVGRMRIESASQEGVWVAHARGRDFIALGATFVLTTPAGRPGLPPL